MDSGRTAAPSGADGATTCLASATARHKSHRSRQARLTRVWGAGHTWDTVGRRVGSPAEACLSGARVDVDLRGQGLWLTWTELGGRGTISAGVRVGTEPGALEPGVRDAHRTGTGGGRRAQTALSRQCVCSSPQLALALPALESRPSRCPGPSGAAEVRRSVGNAGVTRRGHHTGPSLATPWGAGTLALQGLPGPLPGAWLRGPGILSPACACSWSPWRFGLHTSRLRLRAVASRGHSFLPANCLALSPPAPPQPAPSLHFASNGQLCVDKAQPPQLLPGCFWARTPGPAVAVHVGSRHSVARAPWAAARTPQMHFVLQVKCPHRCQHGCPRRSQTVEKVRPGQARPELAAGGVSERGHAGGHRLRHDPVPSRLSGLPARPASLGQAGYEGCAPPPVSASSCHWLCL